jgi:hypothetical protein
LYALEKFLSVSQENGNKLEGVEKDGRRKIWKRIEKGRWREDMILKLYSWIYHGVLEHHR